MMEEFIVNTPTTRRHTPIDAQNDTHINAPVNAHGKCFGLIPAGGSWLDDLIDWTARQFRRAVDARRMAACWNACSRFTTEDLERRGVFSPAITGAGIDMAMQERDSAFQLLKEFAEADQGGIDLLKGLGIDVSRTTTPILARLRRVQDLIGERGPGQSANAADADDPDIKLLKTFYRANTLAELVRVQAKHVERLRAKLPITEGFALALART
jgi:hypothetical protein